MRISDWSSDVCSSDLATGSGLSPSFVTPSGAAVSAIEIQALFVENLRVGHHLLRPPFAVFWELLVTVVLLLGFLALRRRLPGQPGLVAVLLVLLLLSAGALYAFAREDLLLDPTYPALVLVLAYLATAGQIGSAHVRTPVTNS